MARRQAVAASHKLLPPSHRVGVRLVDPVDTLKFSPASIIEPDRERDSVAVKSDEEKTIYELLQEVYVPNAGGMA